MLAAQPDGQGAGPVTHFDQGRFPAHALVAAGPPVMASFLVGAVVVSPWNVVRTHVVGWDLDRADVVWGRPVRQHLVQRRLELTHQRLLRH